jgi:hypothetical protein
MDVVAELAIRTIAEPRSRAARAWRLLGELAGDAHSLDAIAAAASRERDATDWPGALNAWGRGKLDRPVEALAERVGLRALARLMADRDPAWAISEARWHALLPVSRRDELLAAVSRKSPALRALVEARHA